MATVRALGNNTSSVSPSGEESRKARRYRLQDVAAELLPKERVAWCLKARAPGKQEQVYRRGEVAYFRGLMSCGSVWTCPVCSARISTVRRGELGQAVESWPGSKMLLTLTLQHGREDTLAELLDALKSAWRSFKMGKGWQLIKDRYQIKAYVSSSEVTYGQGSGWHPHLHILLFSGLTDDQIDREGLRDALNSRWTGLLEKNGRYASDLYGLDLRFGNDRAGEYAAKWGLEAEVTMANSKIAAGEHYSPFALLELAGRGDKHAAELFKEYAAAFNGKSQLTWSRSKGSDGKIHTAREILGLKAEKTDEEIAAEPEGEEPEELVTTFTHQQWGEIVRRKLRGPVLDAARGGSVALWVYLIGEGIDPVPENFTEAEQWLNTV